MRATAVTLFALLVLPACGGGTPPASSPSGAASETPASGAAPSSSAGAAPAGPAASAAPGEEPSKPTLESQREPFMASCMRKMQSPDYCACGWDQFAEVFKSADLTAQLAPDDPRLATLQEKTTALCGSKLPEDKIKESFLSSCAGDDQRKAPYCQCAWKSLRKTLAPSDFIGSFTGPRFDDAKKAMVTACKGKMPADVAKADFVKGCSTQSSPARCECVWKKLHAKYSIEAIEAGLVDLGSVPGLSECQK